MSASSFSVNKICMAMFITGLGLTGCSPASNNQPTSVSGQDAQMVSEQQSSESARLQTFFENSFEQALKRSPMWQSRLGLKWDYDKWNDISPAFADESKDIRQQTLETALGFDRSQLNESEKLSLDLMIADLQRKAANDEFINHTYIMQQFSAWHTSVPSFLINIHRIQSEQDAKDYVARLTNVEGLFKDLEAQLAIREKAGIFPPKWAYSQMIQASQNILKGKPFDDSDTQSTILDDFVTKVNALELEQAQKDTLIDQASSALVNVVQPAYLSLIDVLSKQQSLSPQGDGVWRLPSGSNWYQNRLNWYTTTDLSAQEIHDLGLENVARIHKEMRKIMKQVDFDGDLPAFFEFMRNDEQFYYDATDEGRQRYMREAKAYIDEMEKRIPEYFGLTPKARMVVKRVEAFREQSAGKAFYQSPSKDGSRPGIYYANLFNMKDMPTYQMEALAYHEGIPGHHMQRAIAQELEGVPDFQKYLSFTAYTEGWGLYTEELGKDMGFYLDPYSDFGRLAMELWRACRLVVDTGIHEFKWSREKAIQYLVDNTPNSENDATKAIERYIALPGQATAYLVGKLKIMELRDKAKTELGDSFDYRGFHDEILKDGPVPMSILEDKIDKWIEANKPS